MRLLERSNADEFSLTRAFVDDEIPPYAILSHTWTDGEEVSFQELLDGTGKGKAGYNKIRFCGEQAIRDGLRYFWVDTCCIDQSNNTELSEAINSMFRWYRNAAKCYVYLSDVSSPAFDAGDKFNQLSCESAFRKSRWFTRGWTLQELLAPRLIDFFSQEGNRLGDKRSLERQVHEITGIAVLALQGTPLSQFGVDERFSWAENRRTLRKEDEAYSLLGIFDVYMSLIYGEGRDNAFKRLREEVDKPLKGLHSLPYAVEAPFNSFAKQHEPTCLPNTRVDLLRDIFEWADGQDEYIIFWLNGLAGTGKSTIARTVARRCFEQGRLGASFFFARGGGDIGHAGKFVTSIAIQLATTVPSINRFISDAITKDSDIASRSLRDQWQQLVLGPLSKLHGNHSYVVVIDALDECDDENNIRIILQLLAEARSLERVRLRVFLTSRPEVPIRQRFNQISRIEHHDCLLHNVAPSIVDHDISIFLEHELGRIGEESAQDNGWPGAEVIKTLVWRASGLFIWAATACRFIREGLFAEERLHTLLEGGASGAAAATPEERLNRIYVIVLQNSIHRGFTQQDKEMFYSILKDILGSIVALFSPLSVCSLSRLTLIPQQRVDLMLKDLHAILDIPKDHTHRLRLHHPSFRDFLLDKNRCSDSNFWVDGKQAHRTLAARCIKLMSAVLKQDICSVDSPGVLATDIESTRVEQYLPPDVQYACLYWVEHLQKGGTQLQDDDQVHQFLKKHLLHWLEALGWMRRVPDGIYAITSLESIALASECSDLRLFIHDTKRFALSFKAGIEQAPLQIYCSALLFAPVTSVVRKQFQDRVPSWMRRLPKVEENWSALLQTLEGHSDVVTSVAFSPDGKQLASASYDRTVRLWDAATGVLLHKLEQHNSIVTAVTFSPDGKQLASASDDRIVRLFDVVTGGVVQKLKGHSFIVTAVTFSPDSKQLASSSYDQTVRVWDIITGEMVQKLEGHSSGVTAVAFSPNGKQLASASYDQTVRLWDIATGDIVQKLQGHISMVTAVDFSPDGKLLASASDDRTVRLWDIATGKEVQKCEGHLFILTAVAFSPNGKQLVSASYDRTVRLWDAATGRMLKMLEGHSSVVTGVVFSPDGKQLASSSYDRTIRLWDVAIGGSLVQKPEGHSDVVTVVAFSPNGKQLASASDDQTVQLWDAETGLMVQKLEGHNGVVTVVAFSPDGKQLASASDDQTIRLWDAATGGVIKKITLQTRISSLCFSSDGERLETDRGTLTLSNSSDSLRLPLQVPSGQIFLNGEWIARDGQDFLWLPYDYRGRCSVLRDTLLVIGQANGAVSFFEFT